MILTAKTTTKHTNNLIWIKIKIRTQIYKILGLFNNCLIQLKLFSRMLLNSNLVVYFMVRKFIQLRRLEIKKNWTNINSRIWKLRRIISEMVRMTARKIAMTMTVMLNLWMRITIITMIFSMRMMNYRIFQ